MPSADDAERRVSALETKVEMLGGANDAVLGLLRDQARTLNGHTTTLAEHSRFHAAHRARFDQIGATLAEHSRFHAAHRARFDQIGATLAEQSRILAEHGQTLTEHGGKLDIIVEWIQRQP